MARNSKTAERVKDGVDQLVKTTRGAVNGGLDAVNQNLNGGGDRGDRRHPGPAAPRGRRGGPVPKNRERGGGGPRRPPLPRHGGPSARPCGARLEKREREGRRRQEDADGSLLARQEEGVAPPARLEPVCQGQPGQGAAVHRRRWSPGWARRKSPPPSC